MQNCADVPQAERLGRVCRGAIGAVELSKSRVSAGQAMVRSVLVATIRPGPYQPRRPVKMEDLAELIASIRQHGVLQPIVVRPMDGFLELVAGERRWRAAQAAGLTEVPAVVRELSERDAAVFALVENLQRVDLLFLEEAEGYRELIEEFRLSQEEVAAQVGKSQPTIANKLRLLRLEVSVRECIVREGLSERHARALLRIEGEEARLAAVEAFASGGLTVRESEEWVEARRRDGKAGTGPAGRRSVRELSSYLKVFEDTARDLGRSGYPVDLASDEDEGGWTIRLRIGRREDASGGKRGRA